MQLVLFNVILARKTRFEAFAMLKENASVFRACGTHSNRRLNEKSQNERKVRFGFLAQKTRFETLVRLARKTN